MSLNPTPNMSHQATLQLLRDALNSLHKSHDRSFSHITTFCRIWRAQTALLAALPARYATVAEDLLGRLEASSLFTEESCSFSQQDLLDNLSVWIDQARQMLERAT
ncbi:hypothetical protein [Paraherbaspirillum soli]|uniref:Uncharacterized protein n=1 Tax=Paraherbaspirillum soli TaxID=631222 RepID=A0ABW0M8X8_9BURK